MFEPIGGSAPKYTGLNKVNPIAAIAAAQMMLEYLEEARAAQAVEQGIKKTATLMTSMGAGKMGYTTTEASRRRKELAIRRISGANLSNILRLFIRDLEYLVIPSVVAGVIAEAAKYADLTRIQPCTNCGMAPLSRDVATGKLQALAAGADVVCFSGDKLLGGPQAGLIVGRREWVEPLGRHPLYRALRPDKNALVAMDAVLRAHESGRLDRIAERLDGLPQSRALLVAAFAGRERVLHGSLLAGCDGHASAVQCQLGDEHAVGVPETDYVLERGSAHGVSDV